MDWRPLIVAVAATKQQIAELDVKRVWPWHLPGVGASRGALAAVEAKLSRPLDAEHRSFLSQADGWPGFMQDIDLLGTSDYLGSSRLSRARELLGYLATEGVLDAAGLEAHFLVPVAVSSHQIDIFVADCSRTPAPIVWFAGSEIDRFSTFGEFAASMLEYNRQLLADLRSGASKR